jgi:hypothetical protein
VKNRGMSRLPRCDGRVARRALPKTPTECASVMVRRGTPVASSKVDVFAFRDGVLYMARKPGALISAAGPVFLLPKAADPLLRSGKWGAGRRSQTGARRRTQRRRPGFR